ncbi:DUF4250 domain-containing protein [Clostridium sp. HMP27]|uniref:DUF4250 domain-containing protein n=1 Tax=Clostridium sp. HMP27 TaxID=1487921 RepID=UPI00052C231D|nr:DUF4250 domain-containing protein [Clostridium sp. HMP27]KGK87668.1 hypothetical protein DP68_10290 [Clostridium sp. HMP27]
MDLDKDKLLNMDSYILFSVINMKLRDEFLNLDDLCKTYDIKENEIKDKLEKVGFHYNEATNQFI